MAFAHFCQPDVRKTASISAGSDPSHSRQKIKNVWLELLYQMTNAGYSRNDFETRLPYGGLLLKNGGSISYQGSLGLSPLL